MDARERKFVDEFVAKGDGNATQAARRAGYAKSTASRASTWLKPKGPKPAVAAEIQERLIAQLNAWRLHDEYTQSQLYEMQSADINDMYNADNTIRPVAEWPRGLRLLVTSFEHSVAQVENGGKPLIVTTAKVKLAGRDKIIKMVGEVKGAFKQVVEHDFGDENIAALQRGRDRAAKRNADKQQ